MMKLFKVRIEMESEQAAGNAAGHLEDACLLVSGTRVYAIVQGESRAEAIDVTKDAIDGWKLVQVIRQLTPLEAKIAQHNGARGRA